MGDTYTRQSAAAIATGNVITASDLEDEFDQVLAAFNSSTGHAHDGTDSPRISTIGPAGEYTSTATDFKPTATGLDLGTAASQWDNAYIDGIAYIDTATIGENEYVTITDNEYDVSSGNLTVDVAGDIILDADGGNVTLQDAGVTFANLNNATGELVIQSGSVPTTAVTFSGANADFAGTVDVTGAVTLDSTLDVTGNTDITGTLDVDGNVTLGASSNLSVSSQLIMLSGSEISMSGGTITYDVLPTTTNSYDLGSTSLKWKDIYIDGTAYIDAISGLNTLSLTTLDANAVEATTVKTAILQAADGSSTATIANTTGNITFSSDVSVSDITASTVDINGGTIDGTAIGNTTPAAGSFTSVTASSPSSIPLTSSSMANSTVDSTTIGATTPSTGAFTTLSSTGTATLATVDIDAGAIDGTTIGATTASTGDFTNVTASINYTGPNYILKSGSTIYGALLVSGGDVTLQASSSDFYVDGDQDIILQHGTGIGSGIIIAEDGTTGNYATMQFSPARNSLSIGVASTGSADNDEYFQIEKDGTHYGVYANGIYQKTISDTAISANLGIVTIDPGLAGNYDITVETNATINFGSSNLNDGTNTGIFNDATQRFLVKVTQDSVGSHTVTFSPLSGTSILWEGGSAPTPTSTANKTDIYEFINFGGGKTYYARRIGANF